MASQESLKNTDASQSDEAVGYPDCEVGRRIEIIRHEFKSTIRALYAKDISNAIEYLDLMIRESQRVRKLLGAG